MPTQQKKIRSSSPDATQAIARVLACRLLPGDVVLLEGEIGAGKTHLARGVIAALLDAPEDIPSPTYTLVQTYDGRSGEIWHADLYRLTDPSEVEELGLFAAFRYAICLVEWPDRLGPDRPDSALVIGFHATGADDHRRDLIFSWTAPKWNARLSGLEDG